MYLGEYTGLTSAGNAGKVVGIYEWSKNHLFYRNVSAVIGTCFYSKELKRGEIINMLTNEEEYNPKKLAQRVILCQNDLR